MLTFHPQYFYKSTSADDEILEISNIISFQVDNILKCPVTQTHDFNKAVTCTKCQSLFLTAACGICDFNVKNSLPSISLVEFEKQQQQVIVEQSKIIVFCIDISGSMGGKRIDTVKTAALRTIQNLKQNSPSVKVALITFSDKTCYYGDSKTVQRYITMASIIKKKRKFKTDKSEL